MSTDSSCTYENLVSFLNNNDFESLNNNILSSNLYYEPFIIQIIPDLLLKLTDNKTSSQALETGNIIIKNMTLKMSSLL